MPLQSKLATKTPNKLQRLIGLMLLFRVAAKVIKTGLNEDGNGWTEKKQHYTGSEPASKYFKQNGKPTAKSEKSGTSHWTWCSSIHMACTPTL